MLSCKGQYNFLLLFKKGKGLFEVSYGLEGDFAELLIFSCKLIGFGLVLLVLCLWLGALLTFALLLKEVLKILLFLTRLLCDNVTGLAFFLLWLFINTQFLRFVKNFHFSMRLLIETIGIIWLTNQMIILVIHNVLSFFILIRLIIPLFNNVSTIKSFPLIVERVLILAFRLEIWIIDIKISAFEIIHNILVWERALLLSYQVMNVLNT